MLPPLVFPASTLAFYVAEMIMAVTSFMIQAPGYMLIHDYSPGISTTTFSIITFSITTFSITTLSITINNKFRLIVMLNVTIKPIMLIVNVKFFVMLSVVMPNVVAPRNHISAAQSKKKQNFEFLLHQFSSEHR